MCTLVIRVRGLKNVSNATNRSTIRSMRAPSSRISDSRGCCSSRACRASSCAAPTIPASGFFTSWPSIRAICANAVTSALVSSWPVRDGLRSVSTSPPSSPSGEAVTSRSTGAICGLARRIERADITPPSRRARPMKSSSGASSGRMSVSGRPRSSGAERASSVSAAGFTNVTASRRESPITANGIASRMRARNRRRILHGGDHAAALRPERASTIPSSSAAGLSIRHSAMRSSAIGGRP